MNRLEKLCARRDELLEELRTLSAVDAEALTDEQDERLSAIENELERSEGDETVGLLADIAREQRREELRSRALAGASGTGQEGGSQPDAWRNTRGVPNVNTRTSDPFDLSGIPAYGPDRARETRSRAIDAVERSSRFLKDGHKEALTERLQRNGHSEYYAEFVLLGASDAYGDGFLRSLTGATAGMPADFSPEERAALAQRHMLARAMGLSDVTGVLVPAHLDTMLIIADGGSANPMRRICRVETGVTNVYTSVLTSGVTHEWKAEGAEAADGSPDFANPKATAFLGDVFVPISYEAFEDARGREADIVRAMDKAKTNAERVAFATGNGTSAPRGLITALDANTNAEVNTTTSNVFGAVDVYGVYEQLPPDYRNERTAWLANLAILQDVRQFGDDQLSNQTVNMAAGAVGQILGHDSYEVSAMDGAIGVAGTDNILAVGEPETYLIYDRLGTSVEFIPNLFGATNSRPTGQRGWIMHHRTGANLIEGAITSDPVVGWRLLQAETNS